MKGPAFAYCAARSTSARVTAQRFTPERVLRALGKV